MKIFKTKTNSKFKWYLSFFAISVFIGGTFFNDSFGKFNQKVIAAEKTPSGFQRNEIETLFLQDQDWPEVLKVKNKKFKVEYTFDQQLTNYVKSLLKQYKSDYTTITVVDNNTGKVLSAVGYQGKEGKFNKNLILTSSHPSASLIKIITSAELIQNSKITKDTEFQFRGRSTTLFKHQIEERQSRRPGRNQSFEIAFAKSNNVIFGKAAIQNTSSDAIVKMAENFGFNQPIVKEFSFLKSEIHPARSDFELAELASGFNTETIINPIHAAMLSSIIANDGVLKTPRLIERIVDVDSDENIWTPMIEEKRAISLETSREMQDLMSSTIDDGTARRSFRPMRGFKGSLEMGGKTGHITGGVPFGKRDWFSAYAIPRDIANDKGISISVMNVNVKRWYVKSAVLAKNVIQYYFKNIKPVAYVDVPVERTYKRKPANIKKKNKRTLLKASKKSAANKSKKMRRT